MMIPEAAFDAVQAALEHIGVRDQHQATSKPVPSKPAGAEGGAVITPGDRSQFGRARASRSQVTQAPGSYGKAPCIP